MDGPDGTHCAQYPSGVPDGAGDPRVCEGTTFLQQAVAHVFQKPGIQFRAAHDRASSL